MTTPTTRRSLAFGVLVAILALALAMGSPPQAEAKGKKSSDGSGGPARAHFAGGKWAKDADGKRPDARMSRLGIGSGEPTVGVTNNGWVFTSAFQTNTRVEVMRSKDQGKSWEVVSPQIGGRNTHLLSLDPYTWVDNRLSDKDASRVFTIDLTVSCSFVSFSDDGGETWTTNPLGCGRPVNDHQTLFGGPPKTSTPVGYENLIYYCWNDVASSACGKSITGGITWTPTGSPAFAGFDPASDEGVDGVPGLCGGLHGHGFVDSKGNVYLPRGYCGRPYLAISRDEGATWETHEINSKTGDGDADPSVTVDEKGNIYYLWVGADRLPYLSISKNAGKSWSKPMMVGAPGVNEANVPAIDVGKPGHIALTYMGTENGPNKPRYGESCRADNSCPQTEDYQKTTWNGYMTISTNVLDNEPVFWTTTVNDPADPMLRGTCGPGRCSGRIPGILDFIDIVIDPLGRVWGAYVDECTTICVQSGANFGGEGVMGTLDGAPKLR
jgi:hypothetical protein